VTRDLFSYEYFANYLKIFERSYEIV